MKLRHGVKKKRGDISIRVRVAIKRLRGKETGEVIYERVNQKIEKGRRRCCTPEAEQISGNIVHIEPPPSDRNFRPNPSLRRGPSNRLEPHPCVSFEWRKKQVPDMSGSKESGASRLSQLLNLPQLSLSSSFAHTSKIMFRTQFRNSTVLITKAAMN